MFLEKASHPYTLHPTSPNPSANQSPYNSPPNPKIMATESPMPVPQFTSSPSQYTLYSQNQPANISPTSSDPTSPSPTSPRTVIPAHTRQLRPPKSPLYVPAVLRPTDPPRRAVRQQGPPTPPQSQHNSYDDLQNAKPVSRRGTGDSGKGGLGAIYESEWSSQGLGRVTGLPTREHWKIYIQHIATIPPARVPLPISIVDTIAVAAVTSSATIIPPLSFLSIKTRTIIPEARESVLVNLVFTITAAGL